MAKATKSTAYSKAVINKDDMTITEYSKDDTKVYSIDKLLSEWDGVEGISLTIKKDTEIPSEE
jgi:hypothetical protein